MQLTVEMQSDGLAKIRDLNLERFYYKLKKDQPHKNWSLEMFDIAKQEYRRFLELEFRYPDWNFAPTSIMDDLWHQHILDTKTYTRDCMDILGKYLHHSPSFDESDSRNNRIIEASENLVKKYSKHYGDMPYGVQGHCITDSGCGDDDDC